MKTCFPMHDHDVLEKRIFNMYDANRDGHIDFREFVVAMYIMANGSVEDNLKQIFRVFDADGNGVLSLREVRAIVKALSHMLSEDEDLASATSGKASLSKEAFRQMDANDDGKVTEAEFIKAVLNDHNLAASMLAKKIGQVFDPNRS